MTLYVALLHCTVYMTIVLQNDNNNNIIINPAEKRMSTTYRYQFIIIQYVYIRYRSHNYDNSIYCHNIIKLKINHHCCCSVCSALISALVTRFLWFIEASLPATKKCFVCVCIIIIGKSRGNVMIMLYIYIYIVRDD